jgi:hypothetical protein
VALLRLPHCQHVRTIQADAIAQLAWSAEIAGQIHQRKADHGRASAPIAFFIPRCLAIFIAQALSQDHFAERISMLWAAS